MLVSLYLVLSAQLCGQPVAGHSAVHWVAIFITLAIQLQVLCLRVHCHPGAFILP